MSLIAKGQGRVGDAPLMSSAAECAAQGAAVHVEQVGHH